MIVKSAANLGGVDIVLYTQIRANIENLSVVRLADLAISSARKGAGARGNDGISYLLSAMKQGISTPLMSEYKAAILRKTGAGKLEEAHAKVRSGDA